MNKTLVFKYVEMSKIDFYDAEKAVPLNLVDVNNIVISDKVKNNETSKYFIGYLNGIDEISPLCLILTQMSGYIKYFENGGKNMSFKLEDESVYIKYNQIWNKIKELLDVKFYSKPIYDDKYIKTKVKTFSSIINILFTGDEIPKERIQYACVSCISIDSVLKIKNKYYPQVYLEQCKYKVKKRDLASFIDYEVNLSSHESEITLTNDQFSEITFNDHKQDD